MSACRNDAIVTGEGTAGSPHCRRRGG